MLVSVIASSLHQKETTIHTLTELFTIRQICINALTKPFSKFVIRESRMIRAYNLYIGHTAARKRVSSTSSYWPWNRIDGNTIYLV